MLSVSAFHRTGVTLRSSTARLLAAVATAALVVAVVGGASTALFSEGDARASSGRLAQAAEATAPTTRYLPKAMNGSAAVAALGDSVGEVAALSGWTAEQLATTLAQDDLLWVDPNGRLYYVEPDSATAAAATGQQEQAGSAAEAAALSAAPYPLADTFKLHSNPGASKTIYLDFDGMTLSGISWTASKNGGKDIIAPAWSLDGDAATFNDAERTAIQDIWRRVAEDYSVFDVDVTTELTSEAVLTRSSSSDSVYGTRVLVSEIGSYFGNPGGIAYVGVFAQTGDYYKPALVFPENLGPDDPKDIAEAASHEAGHNLGLAHDGDATHEYYGGGGSGQTGWAPIMGVGYYQNLTQWSKGEYTGANNTEDDLARIASYIPSRADDAGNTTATARPLITPSVSTSGTVGSSADVDVFTFSAASGPASISVDPVAVGPNLDVYAELRTSSGTLVASSNPVDALDAQINTTLSGGTYYLYVRGTGKGDPKAVDGYSSYGSLGRYAVTGTVPRVNVVTTATPTPANAFSAWTTSNVSVSLSSTATVSWTHYQIDGGAEQVFSAGTPIVVSKEGTTTLTYFSADLSGNTETPKTSLVRIDRTAPITTAPALQARYAAGGGSTIALVASDIMSGVGSTSWRIGTSGAFTTGASAVVPSALGTYTLQYYSTDALGNREDTRSASFQVVPDAVPPVTTAVVSPSTAVSGWVHAGSATVSLSATDTPTSVISTRYRINGGAETLYSAGSPIVITQQGATTVQYWSDDGLGNVETTKSVTVHLDDSLPVSSIPNQQSRYVAGGSFGIEASDTGSGLATTQWRLLETDGVWRSGSVVSVPGTVGMYTLEYQSVDVAGNAEAVKRMIFLSIPANQGSTTSITGPKSVKYKRTLALSGAVGPSDAPGTVTVTKQRLVGRKWKSAGVASVPVVNGRWAYSFRPPKKGSWRFVATYSGGTSGPFTYAPSSSVRKTVKVK